MVKKLALLTLLASTLCFSQLPDWTTGGLKLRNGYRLIDSNFAIMRWDSLNQWFKIYTVGRQTNLDLRADSNGYVLTYDDIKHLWRAHRVDSLGAVLNLDSLIHRIDTVFVQTKDSIFVLIDSLHAADSSAIANKHQFWWELNGVRDSSHLVIKDSLGILAQKRGDTLVTYLDKHFLDSLLYPSDTLGNYGNCEDGDTVIHAGQTFIGSREYHWHKLKVESGGRYVSGYKTLVCDTATINGSFDNNGGNGGDGQPGSNSFDCGTGLDRFGLPALGSPSGQGGTAGAPAHGGFFLADADSGRCGEWGEVSGSNGNFHTPSAAKPATMSNVIQGVGRAGSFAGGRGSGSAGGGSGMVFPGGDSTLTTNVIPAAAGSPFNFQALNFGRLIGPSGIVYPIGNMYGNNGQARGGGGGISACGYSNPGGSGGYGGGGGGSGAQAGVAWLECRVLAGSGSISANGGNGGNGGRGGDFKDNGVQFSGAGGGGGGGNAGDGGIVFVATHTFVNWNGTITALAGTAGQLGPGGAVATCCGSTAVVKDGQPGKPGHNGVVVKVQL